LDLSSNSFGREVEAAKDRASDGPVDGDDRNEQVFGARVIVIENERLGAHLQEDSAGSVRQVAVHVATLG
jgi:hypothetical protein